METSVAIELRIRQGRILAFIATILMPALIAVVGTDKGYPPAIVGAGLLIWAIGATGWLAFNWRWLKRGSTAR